MDPWETLDVDSSDLPSLLRPCNNRQNHHSTTTTSSSATISNPSSELFVHSQTLSPFSHSQTLVSPHSLPQFNSPRLIPGPAGAVQIAMLRKTSDRLNELHHNGEGCHQIPTQEYIRRAVEDAKEDDDFKCNAWLCAMEFVGSVDGVVNSTPLSSVKKCLSFGKVDQVVAVIKSCTANGLGGLMVTLKDPTDTVGASIHHNVLTEGEFAKDISAGSVLILQKVAVFAWMRFPHYLNITQSNVVKVICKDCGPPLQQDYHASAVKYAAPSTKCSEKTGMLQKAFSHERGRTGGIIAAVSQNGTTIGGISHDDDQMENGNSFTVSGHSSNTSRKQNAVVAEEHLVVIQDATSKLFKDTVRVDVPDHDQGALDNNDKWQKGGHLSSSPKQSGAATKVFENYSGQDTLGMNGVQKQKPPLISRSSLPQWTDEQLNELFDLDCEDDSLF